MKKWIFGFALSLFASAAAAQWQVPTNAIPYGRGAGTGFNSAAAAANSVLATDGSSIPALTGTLPTAVQNNITRVGTLIAGNIPFSLVTDRATYAQLPQASGISFIGKATAGVGDFTGIACGTDQIVRVLSSSLGCGQLVNANVSSSAAIALSKLAVISANQVVGALTATTPSGLTVPSCNGVNDALRWQNGVGFNCNTFGSTAPTDASSWTNCTLSVTVSGNALTVALKTQSGADPSGGSPCILSFRNTSLGTGDYTPITVAAAVSFSTGTTGSTFGSSNNIAFRLWIVAINNAGTVVLGVSNRATTTSIASLNEAAFPSTTACAACTTANTAQTMYSTAAQSGKAMRVLGYADWDAGQATAGVWATSPTRVVLKTPSIPLPGQLTGNIETGSTSTATNVVGDTLYYPTNVVKTITPSAAPNRILVAWNGSMVANGAGKNGKLITTRGGTNIGLATSINYTSHTTLVTPTSGLLMDAPGTTGSVSYGVSMACEVGNTCTFPYTPAFGSDTGGTIVLQEIQG